MKTAGLFAGRLIRPKTALVLTLVLFVAFLTVPPLVALIVGALTNNSPIEPLVFSLRPLQESYTRSETYSSLARSVAFSVLVATAVLVVGAFLSWLVERTDSSIRYFTNAFTMIPLMVPAVLLISGWIMLLNPRNGMINQLFIDYLGFDGPVFDIYSFWGMVWVATLQELPLGFLWLWPAFRTMNPVFEEAAVVSGASLLTTLRRVVLPIMRPALLSGWMIFFIYAMGMLAVPLMIGLPSKIFFYSTEIYLVTKRYPADLNLAGAYCLLLLFVTLIGISMYWRWTKRIERFATITGKGFRPRRISLGYWQPVVTSFAVLLLMLLAGLPLLVLMWNAFMPYPQIPSWPSLQQATLENFVEAWNYGPTTRAVTNSIGLGIAAGVISTVFGVVAAWCILRYDTHRRLIKFIDVMATAPIAVPGLIVGVSLVWLYLYIPLPIYGTHWILLIAYVTLHLPYSVRICTAALTQVHREMDEAAEVSGASWLRILMRIIIPLTAQGIIVSILYVTLRSFREYAASIFLTGVGTEVFSVLVLDMWSAGAQNVLAAYASVVALLLGALILAMTWLSSRMGVRL